MFWREANVCMKKLLTYLLIIVFNVHSFGALWLLIDLHWQRNQMQQQIYAQQIPAEFLTIITLNEQDHNKDNFRWANEKEFQYQGQWYDVIKVVDKGEVTQYHCVWDEHEEKLQKVLQRQVASQMPLSQESGIALNQIFDKTWLPGQSIIFCTAPDFHQGATKYGDIPNSLPVCMQEVPIPPPQV
ncbi:MAG TPA: hypothetical protein DCS93_19915 [Microscillaceae bacterium]|nr:hypothetical protein [Microscillaceae bacterium]